MSDTGRPDVNQGNQSLSFRTEVRFLGKDHVGSVRHFEGISLTFLVEKTRQLLSSMGLEYEDEKEEANGKAVYTNVAQVKRERGTMFIWIKGLEVESVGVVLDVKVIHGTDESAVADELLSRIMESLERMLV